MRNAYGIRLIAAAGFMAGSVASAQGLPPAATLVAKYSQTIGGAALMKAQQLTTKGALAMTAAGINATFELLQLAPNRMQMTTTIPGVGSIRIGYDGTTAWSIDPMQGPRLLTGKELDAIKEEADPRASARAPELFSSMQTVADTTIGTERCYMVKLTWKSGRDTFDCYSPTTGLMVGSSNVQSTPMGDIPVVTVYSDYKKFGDFMVPTKTTQTMMGQQQVMTITSVEIGNGAGVTIAVPAEIQPLIKK
ncbi:MAG TPA: hypothetical protein VM099_08390 [Gemmatimonadaceae bacterium]|nr:hypothetical protein [Gemmatimonadaceae bacterium]